MRDYSLVKMLDLPVNLTASNAYWSLTPNRNAVAAALGAHYGGQKLKTLIFVANPRNAIATAKNIENKMSSNSTGRFRRFHDKHKDEFLALENELGSIKYSYLSMANSTVVHHGNLLSIERALSEQYFKDPDGASALVATATLAQGINLPAEIVIIAGDDRFNTETNELESVDPHELLNAAGRAGRAGQSSQGAVIIIPSRVVSIDGKSISSKWWELKDQVFSKSDQCLVVNDPLEVFLDDIQSEGLPLDSKKINMLLRIRSNQAGKGETEKIFSNSLGSFRASKHGKISLFREKVETLLSVREKLDGQLGHSSWQYEISLKAGIHPLVIIGLSDAINKMGLSKLFSMSIAEIITWYSSWIRSSGAYVEKIFNRPNTIEIIRRLSGLPKESSLKEIVNNFVRIEGLLLSYVRGDSLEAIEIRINKEAKGYLQDARVFVLKLVPELSFLFGIISLVTKQLVDIEGLPNDALPATLRFLSSCIKEGFDNVEILSFKIKNPRFSRVQCHLLFNSTI
ncbi:helicase-related protein [Deminuibacter soli]|uniref:Helicase C-terminal domain-containing protein n=1 Tax=Deminuibacter soli TaxID=2291815 RepID=A0A3E1NLD1_9BACT|nr:helicase-related protein [Deminuibacter soli]RFM28723.1 hypothetical protein DXN05_08040 [Deminuibacter soli]